MRKFLLILALFSSNASAEWQSIGQNDAEIAYVDSAGIQHRDRHRVRMWALFDLQRPRNFGDITYLSMKIQREYHCRDRESRIIALSAHAGNMGAGELVYSNNAHSKWTAVKPDSAEEALWNIACGN
ncbi:MAG: surface-adhesin E family protein [Gallionella sp.]|jgi:hypothetical protein